MAAKKCKCSRKLVLEMDKLRGKCFQCVKEEDRERMLQRRRIKTSRTKTSRTKTSRTKTSRTKTSRTRKDRTTKSRG